MSSPRVLVLFNEPTLPADHPDADAEHDIVDTAECITKIFQQSGLDAMKFGFVDDPRALMRGLDKHLPDVVFNLYEGTARWGNTEAYVAGLLEMLQVPFTGSTSQPMILARSKTLTKQLLQAAGLPTARFRTVNAGVSVPENDLGWPVIVKPAREDASIGIDQESVVTSQEKLQARIEFLWRTYGPEVLVEQFIIGREFHVSLLERDSQVHALPFSEIFFHETDGPDKLWPIVSFNAKWKEQSRDYKATPVVNPAVVDPALFEKVSNVAIEAFRLLGCRDYARVDIRVSDGCPYILEVNPNPCISPLAGVAEALTSAGIGFPEFVISLIRQALRRGLRPDLAQFPCRPVDMNPLLRETMVATA